jgi:hypothetical protein
MKDKNNGKSIYIQEGYKPSAAIEKGYQPTGPNQNGYKPSVATSETSGPKNPPTTGSAEKASK